MWTLARLQKWPAWGNTTRFWRLTESTSRWWEDGSCLLSEDTFLGDPREGDQVHKEGSSWYCLLDRLYTYRILQDLVLNMLLMRSDLIQWRGYAQVSQAPTAVLCNNIAFIFMPCRSIHYVINTSLHKSETLLVIVWHSRLEEHRIDPKLWVKQWVIAVNLNVFNGSNKCSMSYTRTRVWVQTYFDKESNTMVSFVEVPILSRQPVRTCWTP